jgi:hypothetical protein
VTMTAGGRFATHSTVAGLVKQEQRSVIEQAGRGRDGGGES